jgi:hypothetical protein
MMTATLLRDRLTGRAWLEFPSKPDSATIAALKAAGWRWSGYRKAWHNPRKGITPPACVTFEDGGECTYAEERADRLEDRADKAHTRSDAALTQAQGMASGIPFGQPILVGHHSEKRDRNYRERIARKFDTAATEWRKGEDLDARARACRRHQDRMLHDPGVLARRLDKARALLRSFERNCARWYADKPADDPGRVDYERRTEAQRAEVVRLEAEAAENPVKVDEIEPGDLIYTRACFVLVFRVNAKTISGVVAVGGAIGMTGKWEKSFGAKLVRKKIVDAANLRQLSRMRPGYGELMEAMRLLGDRIAAEIEKEKAAASCVERADPHAGGERARE